MAILDETAMTLKEAARALPGNPCRATLWRWCTRGHRGVTLEHVKLGKKILISREALVRFSAELAAVDGRARGEGPAKPRRSATPGPDRQRMEEAFAYFEGQDAGRKRGQRARNDG